MNGYNFTERVRKVLAMAREEAVELNHEYVGTEHILLGMLHEGEGVAATVMANLGVDSDDLRHAIVTTVKRGARGQSRGPDLPYTSRAKKVLELSMSEARHLNHSYVGTEHLLLGLLREDKGIGAQVLIDAGLTTDTAREEVMRVLGTEIPRSAARDAVRTSPRAAEEGQEALPLLADRTRRVIAAAHDVAAGRGSIDVTPAHIMIALLEHGDGLANAALDRLGFDRAIALAALQTLAPTVAPSIGPEEVATPTPQLVAALEAMESVRRDARLQAAGTHHLLIGLLRASADVAALLTTQNLSPEDLEREVRRMSG